MRWREKLATLRLHSEARLVVFHVHHEDKPSSPSVVFFNIYNMPKYWTMKLCTGQHTEEYHYLQLEAGNAYHTPEQRAFRRLTVHIGWKRKSSRRGDIRFRVQGPVRWWGGFARGEMSPPTTRWAQRRGWSRIRARAHSLLEPATEEEVAVIGHLNAVVRGVSQRRTQNGWLQSREFSSRCMGLVSWAVFTFAFCTGCACSPPSLAVSWRAAPIYW
jgi:hypothetical protein